ncbi:DUF4400 domain-containing protein [Thiocystis violascens]|uniref:DUF4400 domain-containing protein n=1 Tax=Thiocystis violascens (strain ATCC 17096 / DSM 198 / 6111) TaxID=765911 RepID=I3Y947_THIV6|nr:DUF4400 domain-containing protein [Thiocystis violascens]AFL73515.1 hypothetical protein Thivi_1518 [Thiocystis violascens DSM 198]
MPDPEPGDARSPVGAGGFAVLLLLLVGLIGIACWGPTGWLEQVGTMERAWSRQALGERSAVAVLDLARRWDAMQRDQNDALIAGQSMSADPQVSVLIDGIDPDWLVERSKAVRLLVELACLRTALLTAWAPALGLLLVAGVLEGHWRWRIRQLGFDYPSPVARQASQTGLTLVIGLLLLTLLLPLPLHPFVIPLLTLIAVRLIGTGITHLPKQL